MPDYTKTGPFVNSSAPGISASFLNNIENVFSQPSGGTETGKYTLIGSTYTTGAALGFYYCSLSRGATPVSVTIDTADVSNTVNAPVTARLTSNGFQITVTSTATSPNCGCGGNITIQY